MAGLIWLNNKQSWSVAGWVFDHALRLTRAHLPDKGSSKILRLMDEAATGLNYISLEELSPTEMANFHNALRAAYLEAKAAGPESFAEPSFYPGFMQRFEELLAMLAKDEERAT